MIFFYVLNFPALLCALGNFAVWRENSEENFWIFSLFCFFTFWTAWLLMSWPARYLYLFTVCQCQQNCLNFEYISASMIRWGILHDNQYKIVIRCHKDFMSSGGNPQIKQFISRIHRLYRSFGPFRKVGYQPRILQKQ